jgi:hypothetical protein
MRNSSGIMRKGVYFRTIDSYRVGEPYSNGYITIFMTTTNMKSTEIIKVNPSGNSNIKSAFTKNA